MNVVLGLGGVSFSRSPDNVGGNIRGRLRNENSFGIYFSSYSTVLYIQPRILLPALSGSVVRLVEQQRRDYPVCSEIRRSVRLIIRPPISPAADIGLSYK